MDVVDFLVEKHQSLFAKEEGLVDILRAHVHQKNFEKGAELLKVGQIEEYIYFVQEGLLKFSLTNKLQEVVVDFTFEREFACSFTSFYTNTPSLVRLVALDRVQVQCLHRDILFKLLENSLSFNIIFRDLISQIYMHKMQRERDFLTKDAEERYLNLYKQSPRIIESIPNKFIASYLGIKPESLSRIRRTIRDNKSQ